jgi:formylglycine-generating enzyme required for sulfatase activity
MMPTAIDKLRELRALHEDGLLSRDEFDSRRNAILDAAYAPAEGAVGDAVGETAGDVGADIVTPPPAGTEIGLMAGQEVGPASRRYRLERLIAQGGMGQVWQATDLATQAELGHSGRVALKILPPGFTAQPHLAKLLVEEAARARQLAHQHIVQVYDWAQDPATSSFFLIMECLDGEDLDSLLAREGPLAPARALALLAPVADALDYAWERHALVHRDLKPANLFLTTAGELKLLDFGIAARARAAGFDAAGLEAPASSGTAGYRAPEAGQAGAPGRGLDVYALAAMLYRMLSGRLPFGRDGVAREKKPSRPAPLNDEQWAVLRAALSDDPARRPASVRALLDAIAAAAGPGPDELRTRAADAEAEAEAEAAQVREQAKHEAQAEAERRLRAEKAAALAAATAAAASAAAAAARAVAERQRREQERLARVADEEARRLRKEELRRQLQARRAEEVEKARQAQEEAQREAQRQEALRRQAKAAALQLARQKATAQEAAQSAAPAIVPEAPPPAPAAQAAAEADAGTILRDRFLDGSGRGPELVLLPTGRFQMGSPEHERAIAMAAGSQPSWLARELPQHWVGIERPVAMGRFPVTVGEWRAFARATGWRSSSDIDWEAPGFVQTERHPVVGVNWFDAIRYVRWLSEATGRRYRLPSEAEWEYACRAGTRTAFSCGDTITTDLANYDGNFTYNGGPRGDYRRGTTPVDAFAPNPWGLHDMHGNVWEWMQDVVHDNYDGAPVDGSAWEEGGDSARRVLRGGSWLYNPRYLRSALRNGFSAALSNDIVGFRVVRDLM